MPSAGSVRWAWFDSDSHGAIGVRLTQIRDFLAVVESGSIRAAARKIAIAARMPPASGRGWVLAWRGHDTAYVTDTTAAQQAVEHTGRRLAEQHGSRFGLPSRTG